MEAIQARTREMLPASESPDLGRSGAPDEPHSAGGGRPRSRASRRLYPKVLGGVWVAVAATTLTYGLAYYLTPLAERPFTPQHELLKPAGLIGQGYGVIGTLFILLGVTSYALRKRVVRTNRVGKLKYWLESHIFLCTLGPFLILLHTSFRFGGLVSIAFWSMVIVVASGVFGRYVFVRIPQTINGRFRSLQEAQQEQQGLLARLQAEFGVSADQLAVALGRQSTTEPRSLLGALRFAVQYDLRRRAQSRRVRAMLAESGVPAGLRSSASSLIRREVQLEQQMILLRPFQRLFRYWHLLHMPLSMVMGLIVVLHIAVAILFGYTWVF
jgi:hypothetical protein